MKGKFFLITTILLFLGLLATAFFLFTFYNQIQELEADKKDLNSEMNDIEDELKDLEDEFGNLEDDFDALTSSYNDLQLDYDALSEFTFCVGELLPLAGADYTSPDDMLDALSNWVNESFGKATDGDWTYLFDESGTTLYFVESYSELYFFLAYIDDSAEGTTEGVFFMNNQCWLDGGL